MKDIDNRPVEEEIEDINEPDEVIPFRYSITGYGADYPVDGLIKRLDAGDIVIPTFDPEDTQTGTKTGFQRQFVWTKPQCDRFVESLLLGFPVPGIFLVKQPDGKLLVLDGQQRLRTLQQFYKGVLKGKEFALEGVQPKYQGRTYTKLDIEDRRHLDDTIIHATVIRQDHPSNDQNSIYMIFERLNTGGTLLQPQEIRVALYHGEFVNLLRELNTHAAWRELYGKKSTTLKDQELILRFLAMYFDVSSYARPMKEFLNNFMGKNRNLQAYDGSLLSELFKATTQTILDGLGSRAFRLKVAVNAAVADALMVGIARRIDAKDPIKDMPGMKSAYSKLIANNEFLAAVGKSTSDEENVRRRLNLSTETFAGLK